MISLDAVTKSYSTRQGDVKALDALSVEIAEGEFVAVRGPSGCGKSTLLMVAAGLSRPTEGRVSLDGDDLYALGTGARAAVRAEKIGFVFQMFHLIPYLNVCENVLVPTMAGAQRGEAEAKAALEGLGMADRLSHRPSELSTGERQRVALARALLNEPRIILADEPTGNLDPANKFRVIDILRDYAKQHDATLLTVTHDHDLLGRFPRVIDFKTMHSEPNPGVASR